MIPLETQFIIGLQLIVAAFLSAIIGMERERKNRDAGLRTHMLVGVGACLFTSLSLHFGEGDPGRVASQILPGIGFLGAGAILKAGRNIKGLTTAASIWTTAAIGMAVGIGAWFLAILATLVIWFTLSILRRIERRLVGRRPGQADRNLPTKDDESVSPAQ
jgi:putative Mg2+ transporter-C (MgtC) family protein